MNTILLKMLCAQVLLYVVDRLNFREQYMFCSYTAILV